MKKLFPLVTGMVLAAILVFGAGLAGATGAPAPVKGGGTPVPTATVIPSTAPATTCPAGTPVGAGENLGIGQVYLADGPTPFIIEVVAPSGATCASMVGENVSPIKVFAIEGGDAQDCAVFPPSSSDDEWKVVCPADGAHDMVLIPFSWDKDQKKLTIGPLALFDQPIQFEQISSWIGWSGPRDSYGAREQKSSVFLAYVVGAGKLGGWAPY
ncbi:MAG: hypothetical protein AB1721_02320, partial [Patescibacteria group bacterium]